MTIINIAEQFSKTPESRFKNDGEYSGQKFREDYLEPLFVDPNDNSKIQIMLDGVAGYATSFLEEAFGGLARKYSIEKCLERLIFISNEDPLVIEEIKGYINNCHERK